MVHYWDGKKIGLKLKIPGYNIDLEKAVKVIKEKGYKQVVLQVPEGLKSHFSKFVEFFENETNASIIILADPCFGACDVSSSKFESLGVDAIIHFGHAEIPNRIPENMPVKYIELFANINPDKLISQEKILKVLKAEFDQSLKLGLVANIQNLSLSVIIPLKPHLQKNVDYITTGKSS